MTTSMHSLFTHSHCSLGKPTILISGVSGLCYLQIRYIATNGSTSSQEAKYSAARTWASKLTKSTIPRHLAQVRYDRSSGAGGQHVNTTDSKATAIWSMKELCNHIPDVLHTPLYSSRYYAKTSDSLVIQAQTSRKRTDNENECHIRLYELLQTLSKDVIPGETSAQQKAKVETLQKSANQARLRMKKLHSSKKQSRKGGSKSGGGDY